MHKSQILLPFSPPLAKLGEEEEAFYASPPKLGEGRKAFLPSPSLAVEEATLLPRILQ
jgi:hypothetical protein